MAKSFGKLASTLAAVVAAGWLSLPLDAKESAGLAPYCAALQGQGCDVDLSKLPSEAQRVESLIRLGGPFKYDKDGVAFGNREGLLPKARRGFYREYTVPTPGARNRGARRIVCGGGVKTAPEACYYTEDHYASFRRIVK
jgi:ribonuclease T1